MKKPKINIPDESLGGACFHKPANRNTEAIKTATYIIPSHYFSGFLPPTPTSSVHDCLQEVELLHKRSFLHYMMAAGFRGQSLEMENYGIFLVAGVLQHARITHTHTFFVAGGLDSFLPAETAL